MKTLIYVPIIHSSADMGSLGEELKSKSVSELGENIWQKHSDTVNKYWNVIESYFKNLVISDTKLLESPAYSRESITMEILVIGIEPVFDRMKYRFLLAVMSPISKVTELEVVVTALTLPSPLP